MSPAHFLLFNVRMWVVRSFCAAVALASCSRLGPTGDRILYALKVEL